MIHGDRKLYKVLIPTLAVAAIAMQTPAAYAATLDRVRVDSTSVTSTSMNTASFADYASEIKGKWAEQYIATLVSKGGIKGYEDGTFKPKANITTAELVSIIMNTAGQKADTSNWPQSVMNQANQLGLLDSTMMSEASGPISREKMAYVLVNAAEKLLGENVHSTTLVDTSRIPDIGTATKEYQDEIRLAYSLGLLAGNDDAGTFKPSAPTTREETCVIINRLFKYVDRVDNLHKPEKPEKPDVVPGDVPHWDISDFEFGNDEGEKYNDPNVYIGDRTGAIYPREGEIGPNGKPITRDPVTGVLGFGNGQKGGIYLNRTYISTDGKPNFEIKVGSLTYGDKIRGMDGQYQKKGNYVYWEEEWDWIEGAAIDNLNSSRGKVPHGAYADIHGNVYKGNDVAGEAFYQYDIHDIMHEDGKGDWVRIK